ncbi:MAG: hypothetical protein JST26_02910 [Bacteroidetes bacterium]|nr:hypothetical protein [Bacteroidota bacterium]
MSSLSKTWLTDHLIDFEYKKYVVLDYVKKVKASYHNTALYPPLSETIDHLRELQAIRDQAEFIKSEGHKSISGFDWNTLQIRYQRPEFSDDTLQEIDKIIDFAFPRFQHLVEDGKTLYHTVENHLVLTQVGIMPIRTHEGYLFFNEESKRILYVYQYEIRKIKTLHEQANILGLEFISDYGLSVKWNYESVKQDVIQKRKELPNPAVYAISCSLPVPFSETFLPVAKRYFIRKMEVS